MLRSARFAGNQRLQAASENNPPMRFHERGEAVVILQQALFDLGFPMQDSVRPGGGMDGVYGQSTRNVVRDFQRAYLLMPDGLAGSQTLAKLDELFQATSAATCAAPRISRTVPYHVPGQINVMRQPSELSCWATVYTMMRSWKDDRSYTIVDALSAVGPRWVRRYNASFSSPPSGLPLDEFRSFLEAAGMRYRPMANLSIDQWGGLLRAHGLLWVGAAVEIGSENAHSRIVEGISGTGTPHATLMHMIDPADGRRHRESFRTFVAKYETAGRWTDVEEYLQIRYF